MNDRLETSQGEIELFIEQLPAEPDQLLLTRGRLKDCINRGRDLLKMMDEQCLVPFIRAHGEIVAGEIRYYVGTPKTTKCHNFPGALDALFTHEHGDFERVCDYLASDAIKHGMFKKELGDEAFGKFFTVTAKETIEEGKPSRVQKLMEVNERFVR